MLRYVKCNIMSCVDGGYKLLVMVYFLETVTEDSICGLKLVGLI